MRLSGFVDFHEFLGEILHTTTQLSSCVAPASPASATTQKTVCVLTCFGLGQVLCILGLDMSLTACAEAGHRQDSVPTPSLCCVCCGLKVAAPSHPVCCVMAMRSWNGCAWCAACAMAAEGPEPPSIHRSTVVSDVKAQLVLRVLRADDLVPPATQRAA